MQRRAHLADFFVGARGMNAIGEQDDEKLPLGSIQSDVPVKPVWPKLSAEK